MAEAKKIRGKLKRDIDRLVAEINDNYQSFIRELQDRGIVNERGVAVDPTNEEHRRIANEFFKQRTEEFRTQLTALGGNKKAEEALLRQILPEAYALVKTASGFLWNKPHHDVQLQGGILLNDGYVSQMATGEGKTLTAALPAYLNALTGRGAHVITPNAYLAKRDQLEMSELYEMLGLSCGLVEERINWNSKETIRRLEEMTVQVLSETIESLYPEKDKKTKEAYLYDFIKKPAVKMQAKKRARERLKQEDLERRKKAYQADITYGSASAIAFDYLYDDLATNKEGIVQREGNPNFAIIDEVDSVLFDDARTPYIISGKQSDIELATSEEEAEEEHQMVESANMAIYSIYHWDENTKSRGNESLLYTFEDEHESEEFAKGKHPDREQLEMTRAILIEPNGNQFSLTKLGEIMIFNQYYQEKVNKLLQKNKDFIINLEVDGEKIFQKGKDYLFKTELSMEPRAFAHLVMTGAIPELTSLFYEFEKKEFAQQYMQLENAITAWFLKKEDVDYQLKDPNPDHPSKKRKVTLIINGRAQDGRAYGNGLQQAIEAKEKIRHGAQCEIVETPFNDTLASIPTSSFFERYQNVGGMTGTAAVTAFDSLYGLETYEVPRNKPKAVTDHGERFYASTEDKYEAIYQEVLASHKKGQPVLLTTTSKEESQKIATYLRERFQHKVDIPVLNADVNRFEEEASIVSRAGMFGAITVSTEMAGRGTDIKLGGEVPEVSELAETFEKNQFNAILAQMQRSQTVTEETKEEIRRMLAQNSETFTQMAKEEHTSLCQQRDQMKKKISAAGGLKIIGSGHFDLERIDDQVRGRCGRQGDPGEVIFFNDGADLTRMGVPDVIVQKFERLAELEPIVEEHTTSPSAIKDPLTTWIRRMQMKNDSSTLDSIISRQEEDRAISHFRNGFRQEKESLKRSEEYLPAMEKIIEQTVGAIIENSSANPTSKKIAKAGVLSNCNPSRVNS